MAQPLEQIAGGKYEILEKLREGGMGSVYKVRHRLLEEVRVIKVLHPQLALDEKLQARFRNEAKLAIRLRHPNIAHLYDFAIDKRGVAYMVMEYIDGVTLHDMLASTGPPSLGLTVEIGRQCLQALGYLHRQRFVHRDVAADNLMLTTDFDHNPQIKLIDLGIAKGLGMGSRLTATGLFMGKARYTAPEQFSEGGATKLDHRSDLYSFGVLFYELLTGRAPISGNDFSEMAAGHLFRPPLSFDESDPRGRVPEELRALVLRALEKDPARRISSAAEFRAALERFGEPLDSKKKEVSKALKTTSELVLNRPPRRPASTQERLDAEFRMGSDSEHRDEVLRVVQQVRESLPTTEHVGEPPGPSRAAAPTVAAGAAAAPTRAAGAAAGRRPRRALAVAGALAGLAAVVAALLLLAPWRPRGDQPSADPAAELPEGLPSDPHSALAAGEADAEVEPPPPSPPPPSDAAPAAMSPATTASPAGGAPPGPLPGDARPDEPASREASAAEPSPQQRPPPRPLSTQIYSPGPGVVPPRLLSVPDPQLPPGTRPPRRDLRVVVAVLVSETGSVLTTRVVSGPTFFRRRHRDAAEAAARQATFEPATRDGVAGKMWINVPFVFRAE